MKFKTLILIAVIVMLSACDFNIINQDKKTCLEGIYYWDFGRKLSVAFNPDSTVQTCEEK